MSNVYIIFYHLSPVRTGDCPQHNFSHWMVPPTTANMLRENTSSEKKKSLVVVYGERGEKILIEKGKDEKYEAAKKRRFLFDFIKMFIVALKSFHSCQIGESVGMIIIMILLCGIAAHSSVSPTQTQVHRNCVSKPKWEEMES